ncbi:hypothetical protein DFH11DRAFT_1821026 [Phellopilus nigrolimitatus]|nr:hypothetical protein DFH11DRAFT_1821026 [Phellopilus nigrolimitatus]
MFDSDEHYDGSSRPSRPERPGATQTQMKSQDARRLDFLDLSETSLTLLVETYELEDRLGKGHSALLLDTERLGLVKSSCPRTAYGRPTKSSAPLAEATLSVSICLASPRRFEKPRVRTVARVLAPGEHRLFPRGSGRAQMPPPGVWGSTMPTHTPSPGGAQRAQASHNTMSVAALPRAPPVRPTSPFANNVLLNGWEDMVFDTAWCGG